MSHFDNPTFTDWICKAVAAADKDPHATFSRAVHTGIALTIIARGQACFANVEAQRKLAIHCNVRPVAFDQALRLMAIADHDAQQVSA